MTHHISKPASYPSVWAQLLHSCSSLCEPMGCSLQAPLSMGFSRQEHWAGLPCPPPGDLPDPGIEPESSVSPTLQADSLPTEPPGKPQMRWLNRNLFSHSSLEGRRLRSRCQQGHAFLEASKEESFLPLPASKELPAILGL